MVSPCNNFSPFTPIERKPWVPSFKASEGEAVVYYCESSATQKMGAQDFPKG
ncbi:MAG: hypothetical protein AB1427_05300 [Thermodesulfobacteriota bacterium]